MEWKDMTESQSLSRWMGSWDIAYYYIICVHWILALQTKAKKLKEKVLNGDLLVLQQGYSYYGCRFIYNMSQHMIPLFVKPSERNTYPSIKEKVVSSSMRFYHYATRKGQHPLKSDLILKDERDLHNLRLVATTCMAIAVCANRHNDGVVQDLLFHTDTVKAVMNNMWYKVFPGDAHEANLATITLIWRSITIKIPKDRNNLGHAGEHLNWALSQPFFSQDEIEYNTRTGSRTANDIEHIARAFINDWYFCPFSAQTDRFDPKQAAVCAVYTARVCLRRKLQIAYASLIKSCNVEINDLSDWANHIFNFYELNPNIVLKDNLKRQPGWISATVVSKDGSKIQTQGLQVWDVREIKPKSKQ